MGLVTREVRAQVSVIETLMDAQVDYKEAEDFERAGQVAAAKMARRRGQARLRTACQLLSGIPPDATANVVTFKARKAA